MSTAIASRKKNIEVEFRARFSKNKYSDLARFLGKNAKNLGADDKRIWFFVMPDKLLKVTHNITLQSGKITLKLTKIGKGSHFEEIEFPIAKAAILPAVNLFVKLGYSYLFEPTILRHNYLYKGVELALKYSKTWGYHLELEILIGSLKEKAKAEKKIISVAKMLGVETMSEKELWGFTQKIEKHYVNPKNSRKLATI
jgi:adenylate cyclase class IV